MSSLHCKQHLTPWVDHNLIHGSPWREKLFKILFVQIFQNDDIRYKIDTTFWYTFIGAAMILASKRGVRVDLITYKWKLQ